MTHKSLYVAALILSLAAGWPAAAVAQSDSEASRQLELAEQDLATGNFERAASAAASALRLDPALIEALVVKGLAYKELGQLQDADNLLRTYLDLRGTLPVDERVPPALIDIGRQLDPSGGADRVLLLYGPGGGAEEAASALDAGRRFLRGATPTSVDPLSGLIGGPGRQMELHGAEWTSCFAPADGRDIDSLLAHAEAAEASVEALSILDTATAELTCGGGGARDVAARLISTRAGILWRAGRIDEASSAWTELLQLAPAWRADPLLGPGAEAAFSGARAAASEATPAAVASVLPEGWSLRVDGEEVDGAVEVPAGARSLRIVGPDGAVAGYFAELAAGRPVVVGTTGQLRDAALSAATPQPVLDLLAVRLDEAMARDRIGAVLLIGLGDRPVVRRYEDGRFLLLTAAPRTPRPTPEAEVATSSPPPVRRTVGAVMLGGGLAAAAAGAIVAAVAHRDGLNRLDAMNTTSSFVEGWSGYEAARSQERVGVGVAVVGGVVTVVGTVTVVIPEPGKTVRRRR